MKRGLQGPDGPDERPLDLPGEDGLVVEPQWAVNGSAETPRFRPTSRRCG